MTAPSWSRALLRHVEGIASAIGKLVPALQTAKQEGWLSDATAMKLLHRFLGGDAFDVADARS